MKNLKEIFAFQWKRDVYNKLPDKRYHENQIKNIIKEFDFDIFFNCGPGHPGSEAWSIKDLKPDCKIIGFEPQNQRYDHLLDTGYPGELRKMAVGSTVGEIEGFMGFKGGKPDFWMHGGEHLIKDEHYIKETVKVTTVDEVLSEFNEEKVFIWADIEGSELTMLNGAINSLKQGKIVGCNLELRKKRADEGHCTAAEVFEFLSQYGLHCSQTVSETGNQDYIFRKK
jgi:FkbM family methyltransferase